MHILIILSDVFHTEQTNYTDVLEEGKFVTV